MLIALALALAAAVLALLAYAASRPAAFRIERTLRIDAPPERLLPLLADFHRWQDWSPWEKIDPTLERRYAGAASGPGAVYEWNGRGKAGAGRMEILHAGPQGLEIQLDFSKPIKAHNRAQFRFTPAGAATDVAWAMSGPQPFVGKLMGVFMDMDRLVGRDFEAGLAALKTLAETRAA